MHECIKTRIIRKRERKKGRRRKRKKTTMTTQKKVERGDGKGNETLKQRRSKGGGVGGEGKVGMIENKRE